MIKNWLNKPFPFTESFHDTALISVVAGLIVTFFLIIFQPFSIDTIHESIYLYLVGFGLITAVVIALSFVFLPKLFPKYINNDKWTIGKNMLLVLFVLLIISICNFVYGEFIVSNVYSEPLAESDRTGLLSWIFMTFTVGIFPVFFIIYVAEKQLFKRNQRLASEIIEGIHKSSHTDARLLVKLELSKDKILDIDSSEIICMQAEGGNYATAYWLDESGTRKEILRMTLVDLLEKAKANEKIVRCHKSYIVNLDKIENVTGNARSLNLELKGLDFVIPVSRSFPREQLIKVA